MVKNHGRKTDIRARQTAASEPYSVAARRTGAAPQPIGGLASDISTWTAIVRILDGEEWNSDRDITAVDRLLAANGRDYRTPAARRRAGSDPLGRALDRMAAILSEDDDWGADTMDALAQVQLVLDTIDNAATRASAVGAINIADLSEIAYVEVERREDGLAAVIRSPHSISEHLLHLDEGDGALLGYATTHVTELPGFARREADAAPPLAEELREQLDALMDRIAAQLASAAA